MKKVFLLILFSITTTLMIFSQSIAEREIKNKLDSYKFFNDYEAESNKHHHFYQFELNSKNKIIIAFTTSENREAHADGGVMSIFSLSKTDKSWRIEKEYLNISDFGSWGNYPAKDDIKVKTISYGKFMIIIKSGFMAQGCFEENISCYYTIDGEIKNVGDIPISYSNEGSLQNIVENWEAKYFFIDNGLELPKILLNIKGKKGGSNFFKTKYYVYNGSKYVKE